MTYTPPIEDMKFGLHYLAGLDDLSGLPAFQKSAPSLRMRCWKRLESWPQM